MFSLTIEDSNGQVAEQFTFDHGSYLVGRQENCDIVLPSSSVSRKHAKIFVDNGRCYVEDLNSANGVTVDGQRVAEQRHLGTAAQIRIGDYYLYVEYQGDEELSDQYGRDTLYISEGGDHNKLVRIGDDFAGEEFTLSEVKNTIGRTDDNFILLSDPSISREHAVIARDDDRYVLTDRGSSNGTRVNGDDTVGPRELEPGDRVEFGNVEFVFARGDREIDPSKYESAGVGSDGLLFVAVAAVVLAVGLVAIGLLAFGFTLYQSGDASQASASTVSKSESKVRNLLREGQSHLEREEWDRAIEVFNEILARAPGHDRAETLRNRAKTGRKDERILERAVEFSEKEKYEKALDRLREIPRESPVYDEARPTLEHVRKTVAFRLKREADETSLSADKKDLRRAQGKLERALEVAPKDSEIRADIRDSLGELEAEMQNRGLALD